MSVRTNASGEYLRLTTALLDFQQPYTVMFWYAPTSNTAAGYQAIFTLSSGGSSYDEFFIDGSGNFSLECSGNSASTVDGSAITVDRWYHITLVRESTTSMKMYIDGVLNITNTANVGARNPSTASNLSFSTNAFNEWTDGRFGGAKAWAAALTTTEIATEKSQFLPVRTANLYADWRMIPGARGTDSSGNSHTLSEGGTLSDEAGPVIGYAVLGGPTLAAAGTAGSSGVSGALAQTLGGPTLAAAAATTLTGGLAKTLDGPTPAAAGVVTVVGVLGKTLGGPTLAAAGSGSISGALGKTLGGPTLVAAGVSTIVGQLTKTLTTPTLSGSGAVGLAGSASIALTTPVLSASGFVGNIPITGDLAQALGALSVVATAAAAVAGQLAKSLADVGLAAQASVAAVGQAVISLGATALSAQGVVTVLGQAARTLDGPSLSAGGFVGNVPIVGELSATLPPVSLASVGSVNLTGQLNRQLGALAVVGAGAVAVQGGLAQTLGAVVLVATSTEATERFGQLHQTVGGVTVVGIIYAVLVTHGSVVGGRGSGSVASTSAIGGVQGP